MVLIRNRIIRSLKARCNSNEGILMLNIIVTRFFFLIETLFKITFSVIFCKDLEILTNYNYRYQFTIIKLQLRSLTFSLCVCNKKYTLLFIIR